VRRLLLRGRCLLGITCAAHSTSNAFRAALCCVTRDDLRPLSWTRLVWAPALQPLAASRRLLFEQRLLASASERKASDAQPWVKG